MAVSQLVMFASTSAEAAKTSEAGGTVLDTLGIDWKLLVFQIIGFALLVWLLGKYVFPVLMRAVDQRQAAIDESNKATYEAEQRAMKAQAEIEKLLASARKDAGEIVSTAKDEAANMVAQAEEKSKAHAERIVAAAQESIDKEVIAAKKSLHNETLELVAMAAEKVIGKAVDGTVDKKLIEQSVKEAS